MDVIRALITIPTDSTIPADRVSNSFHFKSLAPGVLDDEDFIQAVEARLTAWFGYVEGWYGVTAASPASTKLYDLGDPKPRAPIHAFDTVLDLGDAVDSMPHEVAVVGSYNAQLGSGIDPSHRRGRVYIGPIKRAFVIHSNGSHFISDVNCQELADNLWTLLAPQPLGDTITGCVYSETWHEGRGPTAGGPTKPPKPAIPPHTLLDSAFEVVNTSVDNAFDTQRRRGPKATKRISSQ